MFDISQEVHSVNELHCKKPRGAFAEQFVELDEVGVPNVDESPQFPLEAINKLLTPQHFESDDALLLAIVRFVDRSESSGAQACPDLEARFSVVIFTNRLGFADRIGPDVNSRRFVAISGVTLIAEEKYVPQASE